MNFATDTDAPQRATVKDVVYETVNGGVLSPSCQTLWVSEGVEKLTLLIDVCPDLPSESILFYAFFS